jgi:acyl-coenzyme A thioesterase PaaI-like protein
VTGSARGYPDAESFVTPGRLRLAAATRALSETVLMADADDTVLDAAATATEQLVASVRGDRAPAPRAVRSIREQRQGDYLPRSPLFGQLNPVAPPFEYEFRDGRLHAHGMFGAAHEGPPGYVHGGWVALTFDEALGFVNVSSGRPGMTARLTVRYRRPTPLHTVLTLEGWSTNVDGRRIVTQGRILDGDTVTAEAEGLFVAIGRERALEYFGDAPETSEPTDPLQ